MIILSKQLLIQITILNANNLHSYMVSSIPIQYKKISNRHMWPMEETLTGTTSPG